MTLDSCQFDSREQGKLGVADSGDRPCELNSPTVSLIIPCRNESQHIEACLASVLSQEEPVGGLEIIVADGLSSDGTREILLRLATLNPRIRIADNPGQIVSTGLNAAIRQARGRIIIRMDAHTEYARDYVCQCVSALETSGADNVGGPARTRSNGRLQRAVATAYHSRFSVGGARFHDVDYEGFVDTVTYGCWLREVFDRIGFFDEDLVRNQDDEFNLRLTRYGGKIWQTPKIRSWYQPRSTLRSLFAQYQQYGYWKVRVIQKHRLPASPRHLVPGCLVVGVLGLPVLAWVWPTAGLLWLGLLASYTFAIVLASLLTAHKSGGELFPLLLMVFPCYHIGYGWGFLSGLVDFMLLHRRPKASRARLTRDTNPRLI